MGGGGVWKQGLLKLLSIEAPTRLLSIPLPLMVFLPERDGISSLSLQMWHLL